MGNPHSIYAARIAERSNAISLRFITYSFVGSNPTSCKKFMVQKYMIQQIIIINIKN